MNIVLVDKLKRQQLFPLIANKSIADIRVGIYTVGEWWGKLLEITSQSVITEGYLQPLYPEIREGDSFVIDARVWPCLTLANQIKLLEPGECLADDTGLVAGRIIYKNEMATVNDLMPYFTQVEKVEHVERLSSCADIFNRSRQNITEQFRLATHSRSSQRVGESNHTMHVANIFIEQGVEMEECILNAKDGPIYIGKNAVLMEGCIIRGPFAMGEGAVLKMGAKIYGGTSLGRYSVGNGEIKNSVIMDYSNKGHDGYLGDSVIGNWCNLGAATNNSNLKNTGGEVLMYNYETKNYLPVGNKCGVIMGDFSRTAINTAINTGTVIGLSCNVFLGGLTPKFIPDFSWGEKGKYDFEKAILDIKNWKKMKGEQMEDQEIEILKYIFESSGQRE